MSVAIVITIRHVLFNSVSKTCSFLHREYVIHAQTCSMVVLVNFVVNTESEQIGIACNYCASRYSNVYLYPQHSHNSCLCTAHKIFLI